MAADLTESPRPSFSRSGSELSRSTSKSGGPFRATQLWNEVISHLKEHVHLKRRRVKMRHYETCFTGTDAVDVVLQRLFDEKVNFTKDVSREKAIKLCSMLMEHHVFEPVANGSNDSGFEDSTSRFFRFPDDSDSSNDSDESKENKVPVTSTPTRSTRQEKLESLEDEASLSKSASKQGQSQIVQELMDMTGAWKKYSYECLSKITPARIFTKQLSLPDARSQDMATQLPSAVEEEVWREVVLAQLLQLVDLPILDSILSYNHDQASKLTEEDLAFSNLAFRRRESTCPILQTRQEDEWFEAALDCLECLPEGYDMLELSLSEDSEETQKLRLYDLITEHYRNVKEPLWSEKFADLHLALYGLIMQSRRDIVLQALKLAVILLPRSVREQLRRLLVFMKLAAADSALRLNSDTSNREHVEECFTYGVLHNKMLAPHQAGQLVMFMMDRWHEVFQCPPDIEYLVQFRLNQLGSGADADLPLTLTYCSQISQIELRQQAPVNTEQALVSLMNGILDDTSISLKEKKNKLKQFSKHHPILFKEHFVNYL